MIEWMEEFLLSGKLIVVNINCQVTDCFPFNKIARKITSGMVVRLTGYRLVVGRLWDWIRGKNNYLDELNIFFFLILFSENLVKTTLILLVE